MTAVQILAHDWFGRPLPSNAVLGEHSWLHSSYAFLHYRSEQPCGLRIGHHTGAYIDTFFDLGPHGEVEIGDNCTLAGPLISTNGRVVIGNYVLISQDVVITDSFVAAPVRPNTRPTPSRSAIVIGDDVWIGARAIVLDGAHLRHGAIVGAGAVIDFEVPPYAIVAGNPAQIVGWAYPDAKQDRK